MSTLGSFLFKDYRRRVLGLLLLHSDQRYHVREIARLTGTVAGTLHKELSKLSDVGILEKQAIGNQVFYRGNRDCPIFEELASILRKTSGMVEVLADVLEPVSAQIKVAFIFGSMASGSETSGSDIDILVIGDVEYIHLVKALYSAQETLGREINPKLFNEQEWKKLLTTQDAFVKDVLAKPKLFIVGLKDELGQPGR